MKRDETFDTLWELQYRKVEQWSHLDWIQIPEAGYSMDDACERYPQFSRARQQQWLPMGIENFSWNRDWITRDQLLEFFNQAHIVYLGTCRLIEIAALFNDNLALVKWAAISDDDYALIDQYEQYVPLISDPHIIDLLADVKNKYISLYGEDFFRKQQLYKDINILLASKVVETLSANQLQAIKNILMTDFELGQAILDDHEKKERKRSY